MRATLLLLSLLGVWIAAAPAQARVVYVRPDPQQFGGAGAIVVARDDGSSPKRIASGSHPVIAPDGRHVAYFTNKAGGGYKLKLVPTNGGRSRVLLGDSFPPGPRAPLAWSHNGRYIAAAGSGPTAAVVDARSGKRLRTLEMDFQFDAASFSPDDADVMIDNGAERGDSLLLAHVHRKGSRAIRTGAGAVWVRDGIFFTNDNPGIRVLRRPGSAPRLVYKGHDTPFLYTIGASADGQTVLAAEGSPDQISPVLIASKSHTARSVPAVFSEIDAVSRHGKRVLGMASGNVVVAAADGKTRVIAVGAINPSWTG